MEASNRPHGYYFIRQCPDHWPAATRAKYEWQPARWDGEHWQITGDNRYYGDSAITCGPRIPSEAKAREWGSK